MKLKQSINNNFGIAGKAFITLSCGLHKAEVPKDKARLIIAITYCSRNDID